MLLAVPLLHCEITVIPGVVLQLPTQVVSFLPCFVCYLGMVLTTGGNGRDQKRPICKATQSKGFQEYRDDHHWCRLSRFVLSCTRNNGTGNTKL